jgi:hypothetical protein
VSASAAPVLGPPQLPEASIAAPSTGAPGKEPGLAPPAIPITATTFAPTADALDPLDEVWLKQRAQQGRRRVIAAAAVVVVGTIALFIGLSSSSRPAKTATTAAPATNTKPVATAPAAVPAPEPPQPEIAPAAGPSSAASPAPSTAATAPADTAPTAQAGAAEEPPARSKTARAANEDRPSTSRASSNDQAPKTSSPAAASPKTSDGTAAPRRLKASEGGFDEEAAAEGLQAAVASAATCKSASSPEGVARVTVTFAPSGQVVSATVGAPFTGTLEAECISGKFRALHVPPFSGDPVVLRKSVRMQ